MLPLSSSSSVSPTENLCRTSTRVHNDLFAPGDSKLDHLVMIAIWAGCAGVHISAWDFASPSHAESILWRVASLTMTGSMFISWFISNQNSYMLIAYFWPKERKELKKTSADRAKATTNQMMLCAITSFAYLAARVYLITQVFLCLRKEPLRAFSTVDWTNFLPHL